MGLFDKVKAKVNDPEFQEKVVEKANEFTDNLNTRLLDDAKRFVKSASDDELYGALNKWSGEAYSIARNEADKRGI